MNILEKAKPENSFRCADGSVISSVYELENRLCAMGSEAFNHHANPTRNDFHNWIRDVFQDYELANELLSAKTPAQAAATVRKHLRKALLAKEEIEDAIKAAATARKAKKNRKLIKKRNTQQHGRKINSRGRTKSKYHGRSHKKRGKSARKRAKKQVNRWLNWLKIVPEL